MRRGQTYKLASLGIALALSKRLELSACTIKVSFPREDLGLLKVRRRKCRVELQYTVEVV